ncbi:MAG: hypothetical protein HN390_05010 [Anaerolineae bacterium]|jgi:ureidoglycolate hydrolase|nr:hypothetical protein [Anaerolineae bacterium]
MNIDSRLVEISEYTGEGYRPLVDYGEWRVAILRYIDELAPENIHSLERHNETDEVFVLLAGKCQLFIGVPQDDGVVIEAVRMEPLKLYNIRKGVYHSHTLSQDAMVLVVENRNTGDRNSEKMALQEEQADRLMILANSSD